MTAVGIFFFFFWVSQKKVAFSAAVWFFFFFFFQVATLIVDPFRPPQPGFSFLRSQSYWCSLSCQKRPFLSSWQQAGDEIKLLVAVLSPPGEGRAEAVIPAGLGSWKRGTSPSQNPDVAQDSRAGSQALAELRCRSLHPADTQPNRDPLQLPSKSKQNPG